MSPSNTPLSCSVQQEVAQNWKFGSNPREVRNFVSENRDAKGIADSFNYQVEMALHQVSIVVSIRYCVCCLFLENTYKLSYGYR